MTERYTKLAAEIRALRKSGYQGQWFANGQEFQTRMMNKHGSFFGEFEDYPDAFLAAEMVNKAEEIALALEQAAREIKELQEIISAKVALDQQILKQVTELKGIVVQLTGASNESAIVHLTPNQDALWKMQ